MNAEQKRLWRNYQASLARLRRAKPRALYDALGGPYHGHELDLNYRTTGTATICVGTWRGYYKPEFGGVVRWVDEPSEGASGVQL